MPRFILLMNWTDSGVSSLDDITAAATKAKRALKESGGRWISEHYTLGAYDVVALVEAKDDAHVAAFSLALSSTQGLRTTTLRAFDSKEMAGVIDQAKLHGGKLHGGKLHGGKLHGG